MRTEFKVTETYTIKATTIQDARDMVDTDEFDEGSELSNYTVKIDPNL